MRLRFLLFSFFLNQLAIASSSGYKVYHYDGDQDGITDVILQAKKVTRYIPISVSIPVIAPVEVRPLPTIFVKGTGDSLDPYKSAEKIELKNFDADSGLYNSYLSTQSPNQWLAYKSKAAMLSSAQRLCENLRKQDIDYFLKTSLDLSRIKTVNTVDTLKLAGCVYLNSWPQDSDYNFNPSTGVAPFDLSHHGLKLSVFNSSSVENLLCEDLRVSYEPGYWNASTSEYTCSLGSSETITKRKIAFLGPKETHSETLLLGTHKACKVHSASIDCRHSECSSDESIDPSFKPFANLDIADGNPCIIEHKSCVNDTIKNERNEIGIWHVPNGNRENASCRQKAACFVLEGDKLLSWLEPGDDLEVSRYVESTFVNDLGDVCRLDTYSVKCSEDVEEVVEISLNQSQLSSKKQGTKVGNGQCEAWSKCPVIFENRVIDWISAGSSKLPQLAEATVPLPGERRKHKDECRVEQYQLNGQKCNLEGGSSILYLNTTSGEYVGKKFDGYFDSDLVCRNYLPLCINGSTQDDIIGGPGGTQPDPGEEFCYTRVDQVCHAGRWRTTEREELGCHTY